MYLAALVFTVIGWGFQLYETLIKKTRNINIILPFAFSVASILFGINSFQAGDTFYGIMDVVCVILAAIVFIALLKRK